MRIGQGYDVHAFGVGDHIIIGGVTIPFGHGLIAHSDGDVLIHALCDALLGASALGDIGQHFPDSDPHYSNATTTEQLGFEGRGEGIGCQAVVLLDSIGRSTVQD